MRTKESIIDEVLDLMTQGNALKLVMASLRQEACERADLLIKVCDRATPLQRYVLKKLFGDELKKEKTVSREIDEIMDLEQQILTLMGKEKPEDSGAVVAVEGTWDELMHWTRPRLDQLVALSKGRIKIYSRHLEHLVELNTVYRHIVDLTLEPVQ